METAGEQTAELREETPGKGLARNGMLLSWWAQERPDTVAITAPTGARTFAELNGRANQLARALRRRGLAAGDSVALVCTNRAEFAEVWAACIRAGFRLTPVNWHLTADEAGYILDDCEARAFIADERIGDAAVGATKHAPRATARLAIGGAMDGFEDYDDALSAEDRENLTDPVLGGTMLYTSGTTGRPKGVHRAPQPARDANTAGYVQGDVHLCTGPLYHAAPLGVSLVGPLLNGAGVVIMEQWDAEEALRLIENHKVTHSHMVPTMFHRLLSLPPDVRARYDTSSLRWILHGAAPCPVATKQALIEWLGPIVNEYYAATEGLGTAVNSETWLTKPGTVGKPNPADQVIVGDEKGAQLPPGAVGLVYLKSPEANRFQYFKDEQKTASTYVGPEGYFTLGDMGYFDEDGYLFLTDRSANLIISGGVNIYPAEVDAVLLEHPVVLDAATIGVPNEEWGEEVKAVVELKPGVAQSPALADELINFCRERLARFKCPRTVDFVDELPRQDNGKIYKRVLRETYREQV